jgi:hypothetical protein
VPRAALLWAAVLAAGEGAMLSHDTAAELYGLADQPSELIHITIPVHRRSTRLRGVRLHRSARAALDRHPTRLPPRTRVEPTVVDLTQTARDATQAVAWMVRACARRLTTVERLRDAVTGRSKLRRRNVLLTALSDIKVGAHSLLELAYLRRVERAHGLPPAQRQAARARGGGRWYDDVHYRPFATLVEIDGRVAHPPESAGRDNRRDNAGVAAGLSVLRYRVDDVLGAPCAVASEVAGVLRRNGWRDRPHACGPACVITESSDTARYPNSP